MPKKKQKPIVRDYVFVQADDFIARLRNQEWLIDPAARTILVKVRDGPLLSFSQYLRFAIRDYDEKTSNYFESEAVEILLRQQQADKIGADKKMLERKPGVMDDMLHAFAYKTVNERARREAAEKLLEVIDAAFTHGLVREGEGLAKKLKECEELSVKQAQELRTVSAAYEKVQGELRGLQHRFGVDKKLLK